MKNQNVRESKGITLIALIITIVVLLILAVVAIGAAQDSNIVGYAQNAAGGYDKAKANEVDDLAKYENEIEKYLPGEKKEDSGEEKVYLGNLRLNTKYISGKGTSQQYVIAYANGTVDYNGLGTWNYTITGNIVDVETPEGTIQFQAIKEEKNDILTAYDETNAILFSTSTEGFLYLNGREYTTTNQEAFVNKIEINEDGTYGFYRIDGRHISIDVNTIPFFYNGVLYNLKVDTSSDSYIDSPTATSTDNCETINIGNVIYTRSVE